MICCYLHAALFIYNLCFGAHVGAHQALSLPMSACALLDNCKSQHRQDRQTTVERERGGGSVKKGPVAIENSICKCQWQFSWCRLWPYLYHAICDFLLPGCPFLLAFSSLNRKSSVDLKATSCPTVCLSACPAAWWAVPQHVGVGCQGRGRRDRCHTAWLLLL